MNENLNGFNNGIDPSDGIGGEPGYFKTAYQVLSEICNEFKSTVDDEIALKAMEVYGSQCRREGLEAGKKEENKVPPLTEKKSITCPDCLRTSFNPNDIANKYCGYCHKFL